MTDPHRRVAAVATGQLGAFSREQAHVAGLSNKQLRSRVQSGLLEPVGPNGFRSPLGPRTAPADLAALMVDVGPPCWASGPTAAALHGFDGFRLAPPFHLTLERHRNVRRISAVIHTTSDLPLIDRGRAGGLDVTSAARTVIDLARGHDAAALARAIDSGLREGLFSEDLLHRRLQDVRNRGRHGIPRLLDVLAGHEVTAAGTAGSSAASSGSPPTPGSPGPTPSRCCHEPATGWCGSTVASRARTWSSSCWATASTAPASN